MSQASELEQTRERTELGFWIYLMTDLMLFASLFATFFILRVGTAGGPSPSDIFSIDYVMTETFILLASSVTSGMALVSARFRKHRQMIAFLVATILLGLAFLSLELREFAMLAADGHSWAQSAFLSSYFTLVGTHGFHILIGLIWASTLLVVLVKKKQVSENHLQKLSLFTMFWHFLDLVWIFIFSIVYIIGVYT